MTVNKHTPAKWDEGQEEDPGNIEILRKNMKIPSTMKLVGVLTDRHFDIFKK